MSKLPKIFTTLSGKIVLLAGGIALCTALAVGFLGYTHITDITLDTAIKGLAGETRLMALQFKGGYDEMYNDAFVVSHTPPIQGLPRSIEAQGIDPLDGSSTQQWKSRLEEIFISVMSARPYYTQMRYIGLADNGRELVRVNRTLAGLTPVPFEGMQEKASEPYFQAALTLQKGEVYFSEVTYNREFNEVEPAMIPTVRVVVPVFNVAHQLFGMVVINADNRALLNHIFAKIQPQKEVLLLNHAGDYMTFNPENGLSTFEFHENYSHPPPDFIKSARLSSEREQSFVSETAITYFVRLMMGPANPEAFLGVLLTVPRDDLLHDAYAIQRIIIFLGAGLLMLSLVLAVWMAIRVTGPLKLMTQRINAVQDYRSSLDLPVTLRDEIGDLARAFAKMSEHLQHSEEQFRLAFQDSPIGMALVGLDGSWLQVNKALCAMLGYQEQQLFALDFPSITHPDDQDRYYQSMQELLDDKRSTYQIEKRCYHKDKSIIWILLAVSLVRNETGKPQYFIAQIKNITSRKDAEAKLRESEERFDVAVRGSSVGLWDWNILRNELYWSPRFLEILGITDESPRIDIDTFESLLHPDDRERVIASIEAHLQTNQPYDVEYRLRHMKGHDVWIHARGQAMWSEEGDPIRMAGSVDDISEKKANEKERIALKSSNEELDSFAHIASHDLKEPLRGLLNHASFLMRDYGDKLDEKAKHKISRMVYLAEKMERLIGDLHYYSRLGRTELAMQNTDLNEMVDEVKNTFLAASDEPVDIAISETLPTLMCDKTRVTELFRNLVTNAIKYNDNDMKIIRIGSKKMAEDTEEIVLYVQDNGIGIDIKFHDDIFRIFKRLHQTDTYGGGTGSGLTFVKRIVEKHGGRIWLESEKSKGTTFYFTLQKQDAA